MGRVIYLKDWLAGRKKKDASKTGTSGQLTAHNGYEECDFCARADGKVCDLRDDGSLYEPEEDESSILKVLENIQ